MDIISFNKNVNVIADKTMMLNESTIQSLKDNDEYRCIAPFSFDFINKRLIEKDVIGMDTGIVGVVVFTLEDLKELNFQRVSRKHKFSKDRTGVIESRVLFLLSQKEHLLQ